jgi:hypothetical protein
LLVSCTPEASLPIDIHIGADHPNEQTSGTAFAHFAALAFLSVALLHEGLPQPFPIMVCTLSSFSTLHCLSLSFDLALCGLHGLGFAVLSRSKHVLLTHGFPPSSSASTEVICFPGTRFAYLGQARRAVAISHGKSNQLRMQR